MQKQKYSSISQKVTVSYILLVLLAAAAIVILYHGIRQLTQIDSSATTPNTKLRKINSILTLVYEAESRSRSYFLFRKKSDFDEYLNLNTKIEQGIDTLKKVCYSDAEQVNYLNDIASLLQQKKIIINQIVRFSNENHEDISYQRTLDEIYLKAYDNFSQPAVVKEDIVIKHDSTFQIPENKGLFNKIKKIFSSENDSDNKVLTRVSIEKSTIYDTIAPLNVQTDSVMNTVKQALQHFKDREKYLKEQSVSRETQLLHSDKVILDNVREIITLLENEELLRANAALQKTQIILQNANYSVVALGIIALILIVVFSVLIFRDISRSKAYQFALQQANKQSTELLKLKENFVANMSHEVRTPLTAIIGFIEQLKKSDTNKTQKKFVDHIENATNHLYSLVNDILDISKSNAGKLELSDDIFNLKDTIEEANKVYSAEMERKNLASIVTIDEKCNTAVLGDSTRLKQVLINIIGNAIKFTEHGSISIDAEVEAEDEKIISTRVKVTDSGIGISKEKLEVIFDEFTQANNEITRKFGGSGLGLSISSKIVSLMKGTITAESEPGKGSTFIITIPFIKSGAQTDSTLQVTDISGIASRLKILIVEDDETIRLLLAQMVKNNFLNADFARDGEEAFEKVKSNAFDVVFTDIQMPGMSGYELARKIREIYQKEIPIIAITAHSLNQKIQENNDFNSFMLKPFKESDFINKIAEVTGASSDVKITSDNVEANHPANETEVGDGYSLASLKEFIGDDADSIFKIVHSFITNTEDDLQQISGFLAQNDILSVSNKVHKLLPMFRQLQINSLIDEMVMIEQYTELNLPDDDVKILAGHFYQEATRIVTKLSREFKTQKN